MRIRAGLADAGARESAEWVPCSESRRLRLNNGALPAWGVVRTGVTMGYGLAACTLLRRAVRFVRDMRNSPVF